MPLPVSATRTASLIPLVRHRHRDGPADVRELSGVDQEVGEDLLQPHRVGEQP